MQANHSQGSSGDSECGSIGIGTEEIWVHWVAEAWGGIPSVQGQWPVEVVVVRDPAPHCKCSGVNLR